MQSDDPPFLHVGTEVSAKFKGAFCEAKVKKIIKSVKCKVLLKEAPFGNVTVEDTNIRGKLELNQLIEISQGKSTHKGLIQNIKDSSTYTVVFNDGDERVLRRTQVCLKGAKHFDAAVNLDSMPLYHPESFASSISSRDMRKRVLKRKAPATHSSDEDENDEDDEDDDGRSSRRSSSTLKASTPVRSSSMTRSLRGSRRSASVTPSRNVASPPTRSLTRAMALRNDEETGSKSPTSLYRSIQPSPTQSAAAAAFHNARASSVTVTTKRIAAARGCPAKSLSPSESSENEANSEPKPSRTSSINSNRNKGNEEKHSSIALFHMDSISKSKDVASLSSNALGRIGDEPTTSSANGKRKTTSNNNINAATNKPVSEEIANTSTAVSQKQPSVPSGQSAVLSSTSRLLASTFSSREKASKSVDKFGKELVKTSSTASVNHSSTKEKEDTKKLNKKLKQHKNPTTSSITAINITKADSSKIQSYTNNTTDEYNNDDEVKKFSPGSVVVINEFGSPKIGGRIRLGMVVSLKEYKANNAASNGKTQQQLPNIGRNQVPVRSFQNGRYYAPNIEHLSAFNPEEFQKLTDTSVSYVKIAFERANLYYTKKELPQSWEKRPFTSEQPSTSSTKEDTKGKKKEKKIEKSSGKVKEKDKKKSATTTSENDDGNTSVSSSSSDEEEDEDYNERRDRFVAHFYKFQDESGNPMNRVPVLGGREIDLYRFYDVVNRLGGHKRVTLEARWRRVLAKLHLEDCSGATPQTVKNAYLRYFEKFEAFMKHLGYSSLNGLGLSTSSSRSSRMIRTVQDTDRKKNVDKRKEQRVKEKIETPAVKRSRASSKDSTSEPIPPPLKIARPSVEKTITTTSSAEMPTSTTLTVSSEKALITPIVSDSSNKPIKIEEVKEFIPISTMESNHQKLSTKSSTIQHEQKPVSKTKSSSSAQQQTIAASSTSLMATYNEKKAFIPAPPKAVFSSSAEPATGSNELLKKVPKCLLSTTTTTTTTTLTFSTSDVKTLKLKKQNREGQKAVNSVKLIPISRTKSSDSVSSAAPNSLLATKKQKHVMKSMKRKTHGSDMMATSSDEDATKHKQKHRRSSMGKESSRVKSPLGHQAVEEQDVGYTNANIFTRFYQGQKVHARHHLRFYDARIVIVKQPSLAEIAKSLVNAFELGRITHTSSPRDLNTISLANMGNELKDALKSMVNTTKCFVHYLGWNSRYDEWLMLHKIRIDEKDDKASTKALEALIPNELSPQLFTVAMDWCVSAEGIPALASTHAYASDQQRPRRLSSSGGNRIAKTSNASAAGTDACGTSQHSSIVAAASSMSSGSGFQSSKYVVSHHSASVLGVKSTASSLLSGEQGLSSTFGSGASSASTVFAYQSPLNATSVSRSPTASAATAAAAANLLLINTSYGQQHYQHQQPIKHNDSGHSSPLSPVLQQQRLFAYQQQSQHYQRPLMEMATSTTKFIIPHIQRGEQNKTSLLDKYTSSISAGRIELGTIEEVTKVPVCATSNLTASEAGLLAVSNLPIGDVQSSSSIIVTESDTIIDRSTNNHTTNEQTSTFISSLSRSNISTLPIGIQHYQSGVAASSSFLISSSPLESHSLSSEVILPPPPLPPLASSLIPSVKDSSSFSSSSNFSTTSVLPLAGEDVVLRLGTENIFAGASADATEKSLFIHVNLRKREEAEHNAIIYSLMHNITAKFLVKNEGVCLEEQCLMGITTNLKSGIQPIISQANNTLVATTDLSVMAAAGDASSAFALSIVGGRTSPITTISSCGAVEDFDENSSSIRQTETPGFNEDDECASVLSLDAKVSKSLLHSPIPMRSMHRSALNRERNGGHNHSRSPCTVGVADTSAIAPTTRTSTPRLLRRRVASSKSPDTSGDEDIFEGQITHADSSHAARLRVQQRMETEHLFASYSFIGLPELDDLLKNANNCEESIKIMEDRMQILRDIYQNFRGKLSRLEKRHKRAMIKKKQQVKDTKERGNLPSSNADDTAGRDSLVTNAANLIDEQPTYEASPDDRPMRTESPFASLSEKKDKLETIST